MESGGKIKLVVWGTGGLAANTLSYNAAWLKAVNIVCFVSNGHKVGEDELFAEKTVIAPEELKKAEWDYIIIFSTYAGEIREQIINELQLPERKIVSLEELAKKVAKQNGVNIINKDVLLYGESYNTDNYVYHLQKRVHSLKVIIDRENERVCGVAVVDIAEVKNTVFDYILLLAIDDETEDKLLARIEDSGCYEDGKILRLSQWSCNLALEHKIIRNDNERIYYALVGRPTWGLMALFTEFMRASFYAYEQGYIPFIDMQNSVNMYLEEGDFGIQNAWEYYFAQPNEIERKSIDEIYEEENIVISSKFFRADRNRDVVKDRTALICLRQIFYKHYTIQEVAMRKCIAEYRRVFKDVGTSRVLGAIYRGTDYQNIKPANHFIQPVIDEFADICKRYMKNWECEYLFLATEDGEALEVLKASFGKKLLYIDQLRYQDTGDKFLYQISNRRENDRYLRGIEYLSALYCITKCDCLVSGRNSGLNGVLIMREKDYDDIYVVERGKYSSDNRSLN